LLKVVVPAAASVTVTVPDRAVKTLFSPQARLTFDAVPLMTTLKRSPAASAPLGQLFTTLSSCFAFNVFVNVQLPLPPCARVAVQPLLDWV